MQILATRKRLTGTLPHYEYRLFVPFDQLSSERQARIHHRTDFAKRGRPNACLTEVIAPMEYLTMEPGLRRHDVGRTIAGVAKRIEALLVGALFPEMIAAIVPLLFLGEEGLGDCQVYTRTDDLVGRFDWLARMACELRAEDLGLISHDERCAA